MPGRDPPRPARGGSASELLHRPGESFLALGDDDASRRAAYHELFRAALPAESIERVRHTTPTDDALANDRFRHQVEAMLGRRIDPLKRGRKPKARDGAAGGQQSA